MALRSASGRYVGDQPPTDKAKRAQNIAPIIGYSYRTQHIIDWYPIFIPSRRHCLKLLKWP